MKKNKTVIGVLFILMFVANVTKAQQQWTLQQCIDHAMKNNISIKLALLNNELNKAILTQSKANALPSLNFGGNNTYNFGRTIDRYTNQFANTQVQSVNVGLQAQWNLFNGFQNYRTIQQNQLNILSGKYDTDKTRNDISLNIANAYLQILFAKQLILIANNQVNITKEQLDRTRKLVDAGSVPKGNQYDVESQLAGEELQLITAQNQFDMANLSLALLLDIKTTEGFSIASPEMPDPNSLPINFTSQQVYNAALGNQPGIKSAEAKIQSASKGIAIAKSAIIPSIAFNASYGTGYSGLSQQLLRLDSAIATIGYTAQGQEVYSPSFVPVYEKKPLSSQFKDNVNKSFGLTLSVPIFNNLQTYTNITRAKINMESAKLKRDQAVLDLERTIQQSYTDAVGALKKYNATEKSLLALRESFKYTEQRFNVGMTNSVDYNTKKNTVLKAESDLLQAQFDYIFKLKVLDFYMGKPISI